MLHILLLILKIIGIILLVILALILLILAIILFVPLRYRMKGNGFGDVKSLQGEVKFSWLLHLVSGYVKYEKQKLNWSVRVAWKCYGRQEEESIRDFEESVTEQEESVGSAKPKPEKIISAQEIQDNIEPLEEKRTFEEKVPLEEKTPLEEKVSLEESSSESEKPQARESIYKKIHTALQKIKYTFHKICDNMKALTETKERLEDFITDEVHKTALITVLKELKRLLSFLKPKRFYLNAHIGFKDPSLTGKLLAGLSILYPFIGKNHLCITPEFEEEVYEGDLMIGGYVRVVYLIIIGWNLIWDKNVRLTYKHIKNLKK